MKNINNFINQQIIFCEKRINKELTFLTLILIIIIIIFNHPSCGLNLNTLIETVNIFSNPSITQGLQFLETIKSIIQTIENIISNCMNVLFQSIKTDFIPSTILCEEGGKETLVKIGVKDLPHIKEYYFGDSLINSLGELMKRSAELKGFSIGQDLRIYTA